MEQGNRAVITRDRKRDLDFVLVSEVVQRLHQETKDREVGAKVLRKKGRG